MENCFSFLFPTLKSLIFLGLLLTPSLLFSQELPSYQTDFPADEFAARRLRVFEAIGTNAISIVQGGTSVRGFHVFRQTNEFYYLSGIEVANAYLLLNGRTKKTTLFLPHQDIERERGEGKTISVEDAALVKKISGVDDVYGIEMFSTHLSRFLVRYPFPVLHTPFSPGEGAAASRDEILAGQARAMSDSWDISGSREGHFIDLLKTRYPQFEVRDLSPVLDEMRLIKSPREIALIRRASQIAGYGIIESIRSTQPGVMEYQLNAVADYIFQINGSQGDGYRSITATGTNAWYGHYFRNQSELKSGELILMDYAPDYHYYTSDVSRIWPVNGKFSPGQKELYTFILAFYKELLKRIRPGVTSDQVMDEALEALKAIFEKTNFSKPIYQSAARGALTFRGGLSHPVGMAVHDVGNYRKDVLKPGMVFSIDPMIWIPEEKLYVRVEDVVVVTESGFENFSGFVPTEIEDIEKLMKEEGILQKRPAQGPSVK